MKAFSIDGAMSWSPSLAGARGHEAATASPPVVVIIITIVVIFLRTSLAAPVVKPLKSELSSPSPCSSSGRSRGAEDPDGERPRLPLLEEPGGQREGLQREPGERDPTWKSSARLAPPLKYAVSPLTSLPPPSPGLRGARVRQRDQPDDLPGEHHRDVLPHQQPAAGPQLHLLGAGPLPAQRPAVWATGAAALQPADSRFARTHVCKAFIRTLH